MEKKATTYIYRLANHDSDFTMTSPKFTSYTLEEYNAEFGTNYVSIEQAIADDPEYLFSESEMNEFIS